MSKATAEKQKEVPPVAKTPYITIYLGPDGNLKFKSKDTNVYAVLGWLQIAHKKFLDGILAPPPAVAPAPVQSAEAPEGSAPDA